MLLFASALKVSASALSFFEEGADPTALQVKQTYDMLTELHVRLNEHDKAMANMSINAANTMADMPDMLRAALNDTELRDRQDDVMSAVDLIMEDVKLSIEAASPSPTPA